MTDRSALPAMRSWLFAPAGSLKKMTRAADGPADIVLLDLEDSVLPEHKGEARAMLREFLGPRSDKHRIWVRVNPVNSEALAEDLEAIMPAAPGGILLPKAEGREDALALDALLAKAESQCRLAHGSTAMMAIVTETPKAMFHTGEYGGIDRLKALSWGAEDLSSALGAQVQHRSDGSYMPTFELARSLCLLGAVAADTLPIETVMPDFKDLDGLRERAQMVKGQGFKGMLAIHPAQVPVINAAFTPSTEELAQAQAVVDAFAANPGAGTVAIEGAMFDIPHLKLARALLASAGIVG